MSFVKHGAVAAKVRALYGQRLKKDDFVKLAGLQSIADVANFIKTHPAYSDSLGSLDTRDIKRGELETAISNDLLEEYFRLLSFLERSDAVIMRYLVVRTELHEIMRFMRLAEAGRAEEYKFVLPKFFDRYSKIRYDLLSLATSYNDMLEAVKDTPYHQVLMHLELRESGFPDYTVVEVAIQSEYFRWAFSVIEKNYKGDAHESLRECVGLQVDMSNVTAILRLKRTFPRALQGDLIYKYLIPVSYKLKTQTIKQLLAAEDEESMLNIIRASKLGRIFKGQTYDEIDRYYYSSMIPVYLRLLRSGSPSIGAPMAYMFLKELEVKNLTSLIECVRYEMPVEKTLSYMYF